MKKKIFLDSENTEMQFFETDSCDSQLRAVLELKKRKIVDFCEGVWDDEFGERYSPAHKDWKNC